MMTYLLIAHIVPQKLSVLTILVPRIRDADPATYGRPVLVTRHRLVHDKGLVLCDELVTILSSTRTGPRDQARPTGGGASQCQPGQGEKTEPHGITNRIHAFPITFVLIP